MSPTLHSPAGERRRTAIWTAFGLLSALSLWAALVFGNKLLYHLFHYWVRGHAYTYVHPLWGGRMGLLYFYRWGFLAQAVNVALLFANTALVLRWRDAEGSFLGRFALVLISESLLHAAAAFFMVGSFWYGHFEILHIEIGQIIRAPLHLGFGISLIGVIAWLAAVLLWVVFRRQGRFQKKV